MIRDRIVVGILNSSLSEQLQLEKDLTLEKAVTKVRQSEAVKRQLPVVRGVPESVEAIHKSTDR